MHHHIQCHWDFLGDFGFDSFTESISGKRKEGAGTKGKGCEAIWGTPYLQVPKHTATVCQEGKW